MTKRPRMAGRGVMRQGIALLAGSVRSPRAASLGVALLLHVLLLCFAVLFHLPDPPIRRDSVEVHLTREQDSRTDERRQTDAAVRTREESAPAVDRRSKPPARPTIPPPAHVPEAETAPVFIGAVQDTAVADSTRADRTTQFRSILDRPMDAARAWEVLDELLRDYPQFRESVVREMIAGSGLPPDSLTRADLRLDQILQNGMRPSWGRQREVIEHAFRSFDPEIGRAHV